MSGEGAITRAGVVEWRAREIARCDHKPPLPDPELERRWHAMPEAERQRYLDRASLLPSDRNWDAYAGSEMQRRGGVGG